MNNCDPGSNNSDTKPSSSHSEASDFLEFIWSPSIARTLFIVVCVLGGLLILAIVIIFVLWWKLRALGDRNGGAYSGIDGTMEEERERLKPKQSLRQLSLVR